MFDKKYLPLILVFVIFVVIMIYINYEPFEVSCNNNDLECKMYNHRDAEAKCERLCQSESPTSFYTGEYIQDKMKNTCQCAEHLREEFSSEIYNKDYQKNVFDEQKYNNYHKLIFG
jgi:hypothetical protein